MSELLAKAVEAAAAQVPLAVVFLVAIVAIVWYALREMGSVVDRNTIAWHRASSQTKQMRRLLNRIADDLDRVAPDIPPVHPREPRK